MATSYPRYLTFKSGELEAALAKLGVPLDTAAAEGAVSNITAATAAGSPRSYERAAATGGNGPGRKILVKSHTCPVSFIDGVTGRCRYTRGGPAWHVFQFEHGGEGTGFSLVSLPTVHWTRPLAINDIAAIEAKAKELAEEAYLRACLREQKDYFARASESPPSRTKHPERYRMTAKRAKEIGGRYALCYRTDTGDGLIPIAPSCEHLAKANEAWREKRDERTVVGCCNRLDRCWELPRFNPLYAEFDPRPERAQQQQGATVQAVTTAAAAAVATPLSASEPPPSESEGKNEAEEDDWIYLPGPDREDGHEDMPAEEEDSHEEDQEP